MKLNTANWAKYPFSLNGVDFVSLLDPKGSFYPQVEKLPAGLFTSENIRMVSELIGNPATMTRSEIQDKLDKVNLHASQAIVELA